MTLEPDNFNLIFLACERINQFQLDINKGYLTKTGKSIFDSSSILAQQNLSYSDESIDVSVQLYEKSYLEKEPWCWANIKINKSIADESIIAYKILISDEKWFDKQQDIIQIIPSVHMSDEDIYSKLMAQLNYADDLIKEIKGIDLQSDLLLEKIISEKTIYFNLGTEIKAGKPIFFDLLIKGCEKDEILLKDFKSFIVKEDRDDDMNLSMKLNMISQIDKLLFKNNLEHHLHHKIVKKMKKI